METIFMICSNVYSHQRIYYLQKHISYFNVYGKVLKICCNYFLIRWPQRRKVSGHWSQNPIQRINEPSTTQWQMENFAAWNLIILETVLHFPFHYVKCCNSRSRSVSIDFVHLRVKATLSTPLTPFQTLIPRLIDRRRTGQQMAKLLKRVMLSYMFLPGADKNRLYKCAQSDWDTQGICMSTLKR